MALCFPVHHGPYHSPGDWPKVHQSFMSHAWRLWLSDPDEVTEIKSSIQTNQIKYMKQQLSTHWVSDKEGWKKRMMTLLTAHHFHGLFRPYKKKWMQQSLVNSLKELPIGLEKTVADHRTINCAFFHQWGWKPLDPDTGWSVKGSSFSSGH